MNNNLSDNGARDSGAAKAPQGELSAGGKLRIRRRHVIVGGLLGAPLITLMSPPALAQQICTFSGFQSALYTSHAPLNQCTPGRSPGYWKENPDAWPSGYDPGTCASGNCQGNDPYTGGTTFVSVFGTSPQSFTENNPLYTPISMMNVLRLHQGSPETFWVTAFLNALVGYDGSGGYPYSATDIVNMWQTSTASGAVPSYTQLATFFENYLQT